MYSQIAVANYSGDIRELLRHCHSEFTGMPPLRSDVHKFMALHEEGNRRYIMVVSQGDVPTPDYNVIITVLGAEQKVTRRLMGDLQTMLGLETTPAPDYLIKRIEPVVKLLARLYEVHNF